MYAVDHSTRISDKNSIPRTWDFQDLPKASSSQVGFAINRSDIHHSEHLGSLRAVGMHAQCPRIQGTARVREAHDGAVGLGTDLCIRDKRSTVVMRGKKQESTANCPFIKRCESIASNSKYKHAIEVEPKLIMIPVKV